MKRELKLITEETPFIGKAYSPKYKDNNGIPLHGIYRREYTKVAELLYISAGHLVRKYKFGLEDETRIIFKSPMVNLENLHFCGGWIWGSGNWDDTELLNRVINRQKPAAFFLGSQEEMQMIETQAKNQGLKTHIQLGGWNNQYHELGVCQQGTFGSVFDMESFEKTWMALTKKNYTSQPCDHEWFVKLGQDTLESYLTIDYGEPKSVRDFILVGLLLGYAIETTLSIVAYE